MSPIFNIKDKIGQNKSIKVAPFRKDIFKTEPHKHNSYFEIIYLSQGKGFHAMEGLLKALLAKILQVAKPLEPVRLKRDNLFQDFQEILSQDKSIKNSVAHYAILLNTTPQNLNAACRTYSNQSAAEVLADYLISEAKRLLLYTNITVSEISLSLNFKDNSHFIKYFKRYTGHTPHSFRSLI
jgi:AraC family transcriptional regulator, transcriptional activator of pobA